MLAISFAALFVFGDIRSANGQAGTIPPMDPFPHAGTVLGLQVERGAGGYLLTFRSCKKEKDPLTFLAFIVGTAEGKNGADDLICVVRYVGDGHQPTNDHSWLYGSVPPGYKQRDVCKRLEPGKSYIANAIAAGQRGGGGRFVIDKKGAPKVVGELCDNQ
jgi:hypothetical protein